MASEPVRIALLARPGAARDRLRAVITESGGDCVLDADPTALEATELAAAAPALVLVALDPQVEDVLERFDDVLFDPAVDVVYEEAELAAGREGWEVARWQRHLVAKLQRHRDVLPPGHEPEDGAPVEEPASPALEAASLEDAGTPVEEASLGDAGGPAEAASPFDPVLAEEDDDTGLPAGTADLSGFEWSVDPGPQETTVAPRAPGAIGDGRGVPPPVPVFEPEPAVEPETLVEPEPVVEPESVLDLEPVVDPEPVPAPPVEAEEAEEPSEELSLEEIEAKGRFERDLELLESRISGLELVHDTPPAPGPTGAIVVLAGIGGPDAVRQLLGALPQGLPRPVLVRQQLDGARYDKLVAQMQRVSTLPVVLAEDGAGLAPGVVHIVPPELGLAAGPDGHLFQAGAELLGVLPAADSAVVLLSGADPALVDGLMKERLAGALVVGQVAEGCYDPAASQALDSRGGETDTPVKLAARIAGHWPPEGDTA